MTLPIARVTLHPDGALVVREGRLAPVGGVLQVRALPLLLDPSSVRVAVRGATIGEVQVDVDVLGEDRGAEPASIQAWLDGQDALAVLSATLEAARTERAALVALQPAFDPDDAERTLPPPDALLGWLAADERIAAAVARLDERIRQLAEQQRRLAEEVEILRLRADAESSEGWWRRWLPTRRARVRVDGDGELDVEVSYRVPGATWSPAYVLDADAALRTGRFAMRALVVQATGEDWSGVRLALSTAPCQRLVDVPELPALRLGVRQPPAPAGWRDLPPGLDALFPDDLERFRPAPVPQPAPAALAAPEPTDLAAAAGEDLDLLLDEEAAPEITDEVARAMPPMEMAMPASAPMRKSRMPALGGFFAGGGAPPPRPAAAPQGASTRTTTLAPPAEVEVGADLLDYGRLRMQGWEAGPGRRGRLAPVGDDALLAEAGVPAEAVRRLRRCLEELGLKAAEATRRPLPPHHVVPGPVQGADVRLDAEGTVDLPSDGRFHSVAVRAWPATIEVQYRAVPRHDPRAFRRVTASLSHAGALVGGPVDVYVDGRLELTTPWSGTPGRGRLLLGLGAEDRLKLVRNVRYREESAGIFGGSRRLVTSIEVQVASSLARPVQLELLERLPIPLDGKELAVDLVEASPVARDYPGEPDGPILKGGKVQLLEVPPGGEARAVLGYGVTLGSKDELVGGDRRG